MVHSARMKAHACAAANLHRRAIIVEREDAVDVWSIGAARPGG
jgi:hypothetical protein